jgi:hypothetical protein
VQRNVEEDKEVEDMRRTFVGLCAVAAIASATRSEAQPGRHGNETGGAKETRATGCLEQGPTPQSFVLRDQGTLTGQIPANITLVAPGNIDLSSYVGQPVQVSGVISQRGGRAERGAAATRIMVREVRPVTGSCIAAQPAAGSVVSTSGEANAASPATGAAAAGSDTTTPADATTTAPTTTGSSGQTGLTGDALLEGLINFNIQQLLVSIQLVTNVQDTVINVSDVLNDFQIQALLQLLNSNPVASLNATELSFALQQSGMLSPGETVVGVTPPTIRDNKTLTKALQEQGVLQPGERVVGAKGARVYKMKR